MTLLEKIFLSVFLREPMGIGTVEEAAVAILFLTSSLSNYMDSQVIKVNGVFNKKVAKRR